MLFVDIDKVVGRGQPHDDVGGLGLVQDSELGGCVWHVAHIQDTNGKFKLSSLKNPINFVKASQFKNALNISKFNFALLEMENACSLKLTISNSSLSTQNLKFRNEDSDLKSQKSDARLQIPDS